MSLTLEQGADEIQARFKTQWDADTPAITGTVPPVEWDNLEPLESPKAPWARFKIEHTLGSQATLGETGNRLFDRSGLVTTQIFVRHGDGVTLARRLGKIAMQAFEGKTAGPNGEVWFRDVRFIEVGKGDKWFQVNVVAEFEYNELK